MPGRERERGGWVRKGTWKRGGGERERERDGKREGGGDKIEAEGGREGKGGAYVGGEESEG